jgi:hypothetical protein
MKMSTQLVRVRVRKQHGKIVGQVEVDKDGNIVWSRVSDEIMLEAMEK